MVTVKEHVSSALSAMEELGLKRSAVEPVLKKLLKVFRNEWQFIESENYRLLADTVFEESEICANDGVVKLEPEEEPSPSYSRPRRRSTNYPRDRLPNSANGSTTTFKTSARIGEILLPARECQERVREVPRGIDAEFPRREADRSTHGSEPDRSRGKDAEFPYRETDRSTAAKGTEISRGRGADPQGREHPSGGTKDVAYQERRGRDVEFRERERYQEREIDRGRETDAAFQEREQDRPRGRGGYAIAHISIEKIEPCDNSRPRSSPAVRHAYTQTTENVDSGLYRESHSAYREAIPKATAEEMMPTSPAGQAHARSPVEQEPDQGTGDACLTILGCPEGQPSEHVVAFDVPKAIEWGNDTLRSMSDEGEDGHLTKSTNDNEQALMALATNYGDIEELSPNSGVSLLNDHPASPKKMSLEYFPSSGCAAQNVGSPVTEAFPPGTNVDAIQSNKENSDQAIGIPRQDKAVSGGSVPAEFNLDLISSKRRRVCTESVAVSPGEGANSGLGTRKSGKLKRLCRLESSSTHPVGVQTSSAVKIRVNHCKPAKSAGFMPVPVEVEDKELRAARPLSQKKKKSKHDPNDISRGKERICIPFVNEYTSVTLPSYFHYIPLSIVFEHAYVNFSLSRIGEDDCCEKCTKDCLSAQYPCGCARETGGEFAYTTDGLLRPDFLRQEIARQQEPEVKAKFTSYCQSGFECPIERARNDSYPERCKGHVTRRFLKECWFKCGCTMSCGNRVVQRGISRRLQVFWTPEGKGWGLRTLEELPAGAFVCEYIGEILTNIELDERNKTHDDGMHTYPVLLDGDWCSERGLKDEEALCLDATFYGNTARFINHRCYDANLIDIPVEIESPDRHYYHVAFFTNRLVAVGEELTWDYSLDFEDTEHPIKAFQCRCGSSLCRGVNDPRLRG